MADSIAIRVRAFELASEVNRQKSPSATQLVADAKEIEKYLWGGNAPVENPPTPYLTIKDAAEATRIMIQNYATNHGDARIAKQLFALKAQWERFMSDLANILNDQL